MSELMILILFGAIILTVAGASATLIGAIRWLVILGRRASILEQQWRDMGRWRAARLRGTTGHAISCPRSGPRPVGGDPACTCGLDQ